MRLAPLYVELGQTTVEGNGFADTQHPFRRFSGEPPAPGRLFLSVRHNEAKLSPSYDYLANLNRLERRTLNVDSGGIHGVVNTDCLASSSIDSFSDGIRVHSHVEYRSNNGFIIFYIVVNSKREPL